jgi:hypothetical protein
VGEWWLVSSNFDWLDVPEIPPRDLFFRVIAAPAHGEHSMRAEILLGAFASAVWLWDGSEALVVKGNDPSDDVANRMRDSTWSKRAIAFLVSRS